MDIAQLHTNKKKFKNFFNEFFPSLVLFSNQYVKDESIALDVSQEAFIKFWNRSPKIESVEELKSYLYTSAKNGCLNYLKHQKVVNTYNESEKINFSETHFRDFIIEQETNSIIYKAIEILAPQTQKIILLSIKGYKNMEISEELGISVNTVRTLKSRALDKLKSILKGYFYKLLLLLS